MVPAGAEDYSSVPVEHADGGEMSSARTEMEEAVDVKDAAERVSVEKVAVV